DATTRWSQEKAMHALSDQLIDLKMDDAVPMANLIVEEGEGDGPNAPSPSESDAVAAAAAAAAAAKSGGSRSQLKAQKHQLELEEEKRIAAEMALNRLRRKAAERRRRASLSRSNSPMGGEGGRIGSGSPRNPGSPGSPGSPDNGDTGGSGAGGDGDGSPSRGRRPSILQRLGSLATSPLQSRRKSLSTPASPSGANDSPRGGASNNGSQSARGPGPGMSDVDKAMALAVAAAEKLDGEGGGDGAVTKGPTGAPRQSLGRPKEATDYVSNPTRRRSKSGTNSNNSSGGGEGSSRSARGSAGGGSPRGGGEDGRPRVSQDGESSSKCHLSPDLPKLQLGGNASATPALRSGRSSADRGGSPREGRGSGKGDSLFEEEDDSNDLFRVLK
ncbi:unnamed protein product, partial [Ectocarpus fasciculatus]